MSDKKSVHGCSRRREHLDLRLQVVILFQQAHYLYKPAFVGVVHIADGNAVFFTRCGVDKPEAAALVAVNYAYVAYAVGVVAPGAGKKYNVAGAGILDIYFPADIKKLVG